MILTLGVCLNVVCLMPPDAYFVHCDRCLDIGTKPFVDILSLFLLFLGHVSFFSNTKPKHTTCRKNLSREKYINLIR